MTESALDRRERLQRIWRLAHAVELKTYREKRRAERAEFPQHFTVAPVLKPRGKAE